MDGWASRGPDRAVAATRQSTTADLGVGTAARAGFGACWTRQFATGHFSTHPKLASWLPPVGSPPPLTVPLRPCASQEALRP